jgi:ABC-type enterochelin transport system substrate-binding protein
MPAKLPPNAFRQTADDLKQLKFDEELNDDVFTLGEVFGKRSDSDVSLKTVGAQIQLSKSQTIPHGFNVGRSSNRIAKYRSRFELDQIGGTVI